MRMCHCIMCTWYGPTNEVLPHNPAAEHARDNRRQSGRKELGSWARLAKRRYNRALRQWAHQGCKARNTRRIAKRQREFNIY